MTSHVDDGALIRYLDREDGPPNRAGVARHLDGCDRCAIRFAQLEGTSRTLSAALWASDVPWVSDLPAMRTRSSTRWGMRAAAAVLLVAGLAGVVRPVRAWIVDRAEALWGAVTGQTPPLQTPTPVAPAPSASAAFAPTGDEFTIELTGDPAGGTLQIETVLGDTAIAIVRGGSGGEDLVVLPSGLRIVAPLASTASYEIRLPARLVLVRIAVGEARRWEYRPGDPPLEIPLGNPRP
jgi:hypothetical protein